MTCGDPFNLLSGPGADGNDEVTALLDDVLQVLPVRVRGVGFDDLGIETVLLGGAHQSFISVLVEGAVVDPAYVGDQANS
jgi:hypothetical protein